MQRIWIYNRRLLHRRLEKKKGIMALTQVLRQLLDETG
jgi:hypothetical protein